MALYKFAFHFNFNLLVTFWVQLVTYLVTQQLQYTHHTQQTYHRKQHEVNIDSVELHN